VATTAVTNLRGDIRSACTACSSIARSRCISSSSMPLVYLGTLVGMAGPFGHDLRAMDIRDWAQRQTGVPRSPRAPPGPFFTDALSGRCIARSAYAIRPISSSSRQSATTASTNSSNAPGCCSNCRGRSCSLVLGGLELGGLGHCRAHFGISLTGALAGRGIFAHRSGAAGLARRWCVAVQGYNLPRFGLVTFGESFHGNHHAFPESARLGLERGPDRSRLGSYSHSHSAWPGA